MSKLSIIGILIIIAVAAIYGRKHFSAMGGPSGNGTVVTETRTISPFTALVLDGVFKTIITQDGGPAWVKVETDENLQQTVVVKNNGETLEVGNKNGFGYRSATRMIVYVNVKDINSISNKSVGAVESKGTIKATELHLKTDAVGATTLDIQADKLIASLSAVGKMTLSGTAGEVEIDNSSVGKLDASGLHAGILHIRNKAVGAVELYAEKEISIDHDGVGAVRYRGPASVKSIIDNGVGKVSKED